MKSRTLIIPSRRKRWLSFALVCVFGLSLLASAAGYALTCLEDDCPACRVQAKAHTPQQHTGACCASEHEAPSVSPGGHCAQAAPQPPCDCDFMVDGLDHLGTSASGVSIASVSPASSAAALAALVPAARHVGAISRFFSVLPPGSPPVSSLSLHRQSVLLIV